MVQSTTSKPAKPWRNCRKTSGQNANSVASSVDILPLGPPSFRWNSKKGGRGVGSIGVNKTEKEKNHHYIVDNFPHNCIGIDTTSLRPQQTERWHLYAVCLVNIQSTLMAETWKSAEVFEPSERESSWTFVRRSPLAADGLPTTP